MSDKLPPLNLSQLAIVQSALVQLSAEGRTLQDAIRCIECAGSIEGFADAVNLLCTASPPEDGAYWDSDAKEWVIVKS